MRKLFFISIFLVGMLFQSSSLHAVAMKNDYDFVVAKDGSGDFKSIQEAIDASKAFPLKRIIIFIKRGVYNEKVKVHSWNTRMTLIGENKEQTIISWDDSFGKINRGRNSTFHTYTLFVDADDFRAKDLTIENTAGDGGQAVALHINGDRIRISNCRLLGNQDTLYLSGEGDRQYFENVYIEGTTDFIFGSSIAWFEACRIHSKKNSYITAASTPERQEFGFVFKNCRLTAGEAISEVYLGRPWRNYAKTVFIYSEMGVHILPEGWHNWLKPEAEKTAFYAEFDNYGPGFRPNKRVNWTHQLTPEESERFTKKNVFGDWNPSPRNK